MAQRKQHKDVFTRLAETGEEALQKLGDLPGGNKVVGAANALRERVDDLTKRVRSLDPLERRVAELEKRLDALAKPKPARRRGRRRRREAGARAPASPRRASAGHAQAQRARDELEAHRRRPGLLAVELRPAAARPSRPRRPRRAAAPPWGGGGACRGRSSASSGRGRPWSRRRSAARRRGRRRARLGADHHPAAEVAAVGDDHLVHPAARAPRRRPARGPRCCCQRAKTASVDQRYETLPPSAFDDSFVRLATAPLIPTPATLTNHASPGSPRPGAEADAAGVDLARCAVERDLDGVVELRRDAVGADEVDAGAARDHRQLGAAGADEARGDLVDGAVAADGDDQVGACRGRLRARARAGAPGARRTARRPRRPSARAAGELGPAAPGRAVRRGRVDEEDGASPLNASVGDRDQRELASSGRRPRAGPRR